MFERTVVPRDFDVIEVPYRERGEPTLVSWKDCARTARAASSSPTPIEPAVRRRCYTRRVGSFNPVQRGQEGAR